MDDWATAFGKGDMYLGCDEKLVVTNESHNEWPLRGV
jgi:hypothetical protein